MATEYLIGSSGSYDFDPPMVVEALLTEWPAANAERADIEGLEATVLLPPRGLSRTEVDVFSSGDGVGITSDDDNEVAAVAAAVARSCSVPDDGSVVLIHWADDLIPLTPGTTASALLRLRS